MGNLLRETPLSEIVATLEVLDRRGVTREDFARLRFNNGVNKLARKVADAIKGDDLLSKTRRILDFSGDEPDWCPRCGKIRPGKHLPSCSKF